MKIWHWLLIGAGILAATSGVIVNRTYTYTIKVMAEAIKEFEGWNEGSTSWRNDNPGNLKYAGQPGAISSDARGFAIFDCYESGWNALLNQLYIAFNGTSHVYKPSDTLSEFFKKYSEGDTTNYAAFVAGRLGVSVDTRLDELS